MFCFSKSNLKRLRSSCSNLGGWLKPRSTAANLCKRGLAVIFCGCSNSDSQTVSMKRRQRVRLSTQKIKKRTNPVAASRPRLACFGPAELGKQLLSRLSSQFSRLIYARLFTTICTRNRPFQGWVYHHARISSYWEFFLWIQTSSCTISYTKVWLPKG